MNEQQVIQETPGPRTRRSLAQDLRALGLRAGMIVEVHTAMSKLGWIAGGPVAVVQAFLDVLTDTGTLVMPTHTGNYTDPAKWRNPPVPESWLPTLYAEMPAFDPALAPTWFMGQVVETFRTWPGTLRSSHPSLSFAARGPLAQTILEGHALAFALGEQSPLARLYDLDASVLLLGVGYERCTSLHLAEYRLPHRSLTQEGSPIIEDGQRVWKTYEDIELNSDLFPEIGAAFEAQTDHVQHGLVGSAAAILLPQRPAVDFAVDWLIRQSRTEPSP